MPERSALTQAVQLGVETTPGTSVPANKLLGSIGIQPAVQLETNRFRPMGQKFPSVIVPGKEFVEAEIEGAGSYTELAYMFASCLNYAAPVQEGATTAYRHVYVPAARAEDTVKSYTIEQGGAVRAHKFTNGIITELGLTFTRDSVEVGGAMLGRQLQDNITLTATPSAIEEKPIIPAHVDVFIDSTSAALGTTKMLRVISVEWSLGDRFSPIWPLDSALTSFATHVEQEPSGSVTVRMAADAQGMARLTTLRAGATEFLRILATSPDLAGTGFPYKLQMDQAVKIESVGDFDDEDGLYVIEWEYNFVYDGTWTKAIEVKLWNKISVL
jgi:hypothetical protein